MLPPVDAGDSHGVLFPWVAVLECEHIFARAFSVGIPSSTSMGQGLAPPKRCAAVACFRVLPAEGPVYVNFSSQGFWGPAGVNANHTPAGGQGCGH